MTDSKRRLKFDKGHIAQCLLGICLLVGVFLAGLAAGNALIFITFGIALPLGLLISNLSFWVPAIGLFFWGGQDGRKTGWALAPLVFIATWLVASVLARLVVSTQAAGIVPMTDPTLSEIRTLIVEEPIRQKIIADGFVDKVVTVSYSDSERTIAEKIIETTLAKGDQCSEADHKASSLLNNAGRTDECFKSTAREHIGDGLFIRRSFMKRQNRGCCNSISASVRRNNTVEPRIEWRQGFALVPSYIPMSGFLSGKPPPIWGVGGGPIVRVRFGAADISVETMVSAIYGVDLNSPMAIAKVRGEELAKRAAELDAVETPSTRGQALSVALLAFDAGYVDETIIHIMAKSRFYDLSYRSKRDARDFIQKASVQDKKRFKEELFRLLVTKPSPCESWCKPSRMNFFQDEDTADRAASLFAEHGELSYSQYRGLLDIASIRRASPRRNDLFNSIVEGPDRALSIKLIAFLNDAMSLSTDEMKRVSAQFDRMADEEFAQFNEQATQIPPMEMRDGEIVPDAATYLAYCASALARAEQIKAPELRREAVELATKRLSFANRKFGSEAENAPGVQ